MAEKGGKFKVRTAPRVARGVSRRGQSRTPTAHAVSLDKGLKSTYPRPAILSNLFELTRMSDIFLSCATDDGVTAKKLADIFRHQGWPVWWDASTIMPGADYIERVMEELEHSKVVVMLWSRAASESRLVRAARSRAGAIPIVTVMLEDFGTMFEQDFDLSDWDGSESHAELQSLLRHLHKLIPTSARPAKLPASIEELSLPEIQENARLGIKEDADSEAEGGAQFKGVFISYRRGGATAYAGRLYDRLAARFGKEKVFIDTETENVGWGEDFVEAITSAAESCAVMVVLISPRWLRGEDAQAGRPDYVRLEVATALGRKIRVIPILIQGASMPAPEELPENLARLARLNAIPLSDDARWERDVEVLMKTLEKILNG